jgi:membrane protease YdiL (CAAX protease family)
MADPERRYIFDDPKNIKRLLYALYVACALSVLAEFFIHRHVEHPFERVFGFYAIYGFVAIVVLVLVAKELRRLVRRKEDYYDA